MALSNLHPILYHTSLFRQRTARSAASRLRRHAFARARSSDPLPVDLYTHQSTLMRAYPGVHEELQLGKIENLRQAAACIDGVLIRPGERFSFWELVGKPTYTRGFRDGFVISAGEVKSGIGGGLCQAGNLLHWMFLHTPLQVTERHRHSFDVFPDRNRRVPFGSGATLFYNYLDLQAHNPTDQTIQIRLWLDETHLRGEVRAERVPEESYHVEERDHGFYRERITDQWTRHNKIFKRTHNRATGNLLSEQLVCENTCRVLYTPEETGHPSS